MKKIIIILMAVVITVSLAACGKADNGSVSNASDADRNAAALDGVTENDAADNTDRQDNLTEEGTKTLVVYFSATGTTKGVAETIASNVQADIFEIVPQEPYTAADLDWHDNSSRSTMEMNDSSSRPDISGTVENMAQYEIVFIGYPIWWGEAPRVVSTFMESCSFEGKTVIPFCTSSSSGIGSSGRNLENLTSGATWMEGRRFSGGASADDILSWIDGLGLECE